MKKQFVVGTLATVLLLTGCMGTNTKEEGRRATDTAPIENTRYQDGVNQKRNTTENINNRASDKNRVRDADHYEISSEAADRIVTEISEIDSAYVLTSNRNAYVAAELDRDDGDRTSTEKDRTKTDNRNKADRSNERGLNRGNVGNLEDQRNSRSSIVDEDDRNNRGTDNMGEGHEVTDDVKDKITDIVQSVDPNIKNVYVTTSPDFVDLVNNYADDVDNGRPVRGFFDEVGNMIERVFPQNNR